MLYPHYRHMPLAQTNSSSKRVFICKAYIWPKDKINYAIKGFCIEKIQIIFSRVNNWPQKADIHQLTVSVYSYLLERHTTTCTQCPEKAPT